MFNQASRLGEFDQSESFLVQAHQIKCFFRVLYFSVVLSEVDNYNQAPSPKSLYSLQTMPQPPNSIPIPAAFLLLDLQNKASIKSPTKDQTTE